MSIQLQLLFNKSILEKKFSTKPIYRIIEEIKTLKKRYKVNSFSFMHDSFASDKKWLSKFCKTLEDEKLDINWVCSARIDCVDETLLKLMAKVGCRAVYYGVETGSERIQKLIRKNLQLENITKIIDATLEAEMSTTLSFISGFIDEDYNDLHATLDLIQKLLYKNTNIQLHLLAPLVGTSDYNHNHDKLGFDGYYSDISGISSMFLEPELFKQYPKIFASYHFYENTKIPRDLLKGLDVFINGPCGVMRRTITNLIETKGSLHEVYLDWQKWVKTKNLDREWSEKRTIEKILLDFYDYVLSQVQDDKLDFDPGYTGDEILAFYLHQYNRTPVQYVHIKNSLEPEN